MTTPTAEPSTSPSRSRPARRAIDDLSLPGEALDDVLARSAASEPAWLHDDRLAAAAAYRALPPESNLLYTPYIDLRAAQLHHVRFVAAPTGEAIDDTLPPELDAVVEIREGVLSVRAMSAAAAAAGVRIEITTDGSGADAHRDVLTDPSTLPAGDKFAQLARAGWTQAVIVDVPAGVVLAHPIVVRWAVGVAGRGIIGRTVVHLGAGASASVVEELVASDEDATASRDQAFFAGTIEVKLDADASLRVASLQELPSNVVAIQHRTAAIGSGATLRWALAQLGGRLVRSRVDNRLVGDRSRVEQVEIVFGGAEQLFDLTSYTTHIGRDTTGDLLSKGALLDRARSYMKGLITIDKSAVGTDSFLGEFGMNLSKATRSVAIPSLEIDQPDCRRAAHSSSVGPIDETQLFYLESRGIPPDEARKFIVLGFLEPVVARVPLESAQDRLRELLEDKWAAGLGGGATAAA